MADPTTWPATPAESLALLEALSRYCTCVFDERLTLTEVCPSHRLLLDEPALARLLALRHQAADLRRAEGIGPAQSVG